MQRAEHPLRPQPQQFDAFHGGLARRQQPHHAYRAAQSSQRHAGQHVHCNRLVHAELLGGPDRHDAEQAAIAIEPPIDTHRRIGQRHCAGCQHVPPGELWGADDFQAQLRQARNRHRKRHPRRISGGELLDHLLQRRVVEQGAAGPPSRMRRHELGATWIEPGAGQVVSLDSGSDGPTVDRSHRAANHHVRPKYGFEGIPHTGLISAEHPAGGKDQRALHSFIVLEAILREWTPAHSVSVPMATVRRSP